MQPDFTSDEKFLSIIGQFSTLVCSEENCIPFNQKLTVDIPLSDSTVLHSEYQEISRKVRDQLLMSPPINAKISAAMKEGSVGLQFEHSSLSEFSLNQFIFFPDGDFFTHGEKQDFKLSDDGKLSLTLSLNSLSEQVSSNIKGELYHPEFEHAWRIDLSIEQVFYGERGSDVVVSSTSEILKVESGFNQLLIMLGLLLVAMSIWLYGKTKYPAKPSMGRTLWRLLSAVLLLFGIWLGYPSKPADSIEQITWNPWSPEKELALLADGRGVFIDFTARWCMSCQVNKGVYYKQSIIEKFKELNIATLQADWTKRGPVILKALQRYDREGVPLYVYYPPRKKDEPAKDPILLPEILTQKIVLKVIEDEEPYFVTEANSFLGILGFAFIGGVILNLMPCVFPVLGLKIMSFVKKAGEDVSKVRIHGIVFALGVLLSFWILVGVLLGLRESLQGDLGWGFQLQEPIFVFGLAVFLLIFAMSLSGVFEMGMSFTGVGGKLSGKSGYLGSFFSGFLATIVATPCMAPFLGVAVGAALAMPWHSAFIIFTSIALGLASPYILLSLFPKWISRLPKPGAWMDTFKQAMAFPIYATVAWLLWTLNSLI
jgi:thiol:disulfide interchange protein